jgi:hypothetical protein
MGKFDHYNTNPFRSLETRLEKGEFIPPEVVAHSIRNRGAAPVTEPILAYVCGLLTGEVIRPKGRLPLEPWRRAIYDWLLATDYEHRLEWLRARKKKYGNLQYINAAGQLKACSKPPNEIAARLAAKRHLTGAASWKRARDIVSSYNKALHSTNEKPE